MTTTPHYLRRRLPLPLSKRCIPHTRHHLPPPALLTHNRSFHATPGTRSDAFPNHYETLELPSSATSQEIKTQFYALSKKYHPDVNHTSSASERFVKISEAYHILGSAEKKGKYDKDFHRAHSHARHGSHHSRSGGPAGGRPASGLSKRRSQFRGPPPSFYAQGGYRTRGSKRQRAQSEADARHESSSSSSTFSDDPHAQREGGLGSRPSYTGTGGYSPGSNDSAYFDPHPSMPYFDRESHRRTHDNLGARREGARPAPDPGQEMGGGGPGLFANFLIVSTVVAVATIAASTVLEFVRAGPRREGGALRKRPDG